MNSDIQITLSPTPSGSILMKKIGHPFKRTLSITLNNEPTTASQLVNDLQIKLNLHEIMVLRYEEGGQVPQYWLVKHLKFELAVHQCIIVMMHAAGPITWVPWDGPEMEEAAFRIQQSYVTNYEP